VANAWQLVPDDDNPVIFSRVSTTAETGRSRAATSARGIVRPFRRLYGDVATGTDTDLVVSNVGQVLGTIAANDYSGGECPWNPAIGSWLRLLKFRNNSPTLAEQAKAFVARPLRVFEPRCGVRAVRVEQTDTALRLLVTWDLLAPGGAGVIVPGIVTEVALGS